MGIKIEKDHGPVGGPFILPRTLYLTAGRDRAVEEGHPDAAYVLGGKGTTIPGALAKSLGLVDETGPVVVAPVDHVGVLKQRVEGLLNFIGKQHAKMVQMSREITGLREASSKESPAKPETKAKPGPTETKAIKGPKETK